MHSAENKLKIQAVGSQIRRQLRGQGQSTSVPLHFVLLRKVYISHTLLYSGNRERGQFVLKERSLCMWC